MAHLTPWMVETFVRLHSTPPDESGYVTAGHVVVSVKRLAGLSLNEFSTLMVESDARAMKLAQGLPRQDDWRTVVLKNVRETQKRLDPPGGPCRYAVLCVPAAKKHAGAAPAILEFRIDWLRTASDEEVLRAIDASESPACHSPPATVVSNTVPYWPRQMATRPRDPDEKG
jgi:hypothetical protein